MISDGDFGRCAVKSDGDFGRCAVNSDAAVNSDGEPTTPPGGGEPNRHMYYLLINLCTTGPTHTFISSISFTVPVILPKLYKLHVLY